MHSPGPSPSATRQNANQGIGRASLAALGTGDGFLPPAGTELLLEGSDSDAVGLSTFGAFRAAIGLEVRDLVISSHKSVD